MTMLKNAVSTNIFLICIIFFLCRSQRITCIQYLISGSAQFAKIKTIQFCDKKSGSALFAKTNLYAQKHRVISKVRNVHVSIMWFNCFLAIEDNSHLLITFANSLYPYQDGQNMGPDLDTNRLTL